MVRLSNACKVFSVLTLVGGLTVLLQLKIIFPSNNQNDVSSMSADFSLLRLWESDTKSSYSLTVEDVQDETKWLNRLQCKPQKNIAFLKIHKCASSTVQNVLMRYGFHHNLLFAMPEKSHIFPLNEPFKSSFVLSGAPFHTNKSNIFTMHTKWDKNEVSKILFPDASYFTIVREPSEAFISLFDYFAFETFYGMPLHTFVESHDRDMNHFMGCLGYNIMACDMGAKPYDYNDAKAIRLLTAQMDMDFDFVMVAERFEESLVLLSHLLCWPYAQLVVFNVNSRNKKKDLLTPEIKDILKDRLKPDYYIYEYFTRKFDILVKAFGKERMAVELIKLRKVTTDKLDSCGIVKSRPKNADEPETAGASKVYALTTNSTDLLCQALIRPEQAFVGRLKKKQEQMLKRRRKV